MPMEKEKERFIQILEDAFNKGNVDELVAICSQDIIYHVPPLPDFNGVEAFKEMCINLINTYTENQLKVDELIWENNSSAMKWTWKCKHTGQSPYLPIPPTGKQLTFTALSLCHWSNNKIKEWWDYIDMMGFFQQLGVSPPMGQNEG